MPRSRSLSDLIEQNRANQVTGGTSIGRSFNIPSDSIAAANLGSAPGVGITKNKGKKGIVGSAITGAMDAKKAGTSVWEGAKEGAKKAESVEGLKKLFSFLGG